MILSSIALVAGAGLLGASIRVVLGWASKKKAKWDWKMYILNVIPAVIGTLVLGITMLPLDFSLISGYGTLITLLAASAGLGSLKDKVYKR